MQGATLRKNPQRGGAVERHPCAHHFPLHKILLQCQMILKQTARAHLYMNQPIVRFPIHD